MKNRCENGRFLMARYTLRLFHTFAIFEKNRKIDAKRETKSKGFCSKNRPWALQGRLILPFWSIFEDSKNHCFFDVFWRAEVGLKRKTFIKFSYFITPALLPKQA